MPRTAVLTVCDPPDHWRFTDLTGRKFGRLTVLSFAGRYGKHYAFHCECECGNKAPVRGGSLTAGNILSCGCLLGDKNKERLTTHGLGGTPIWRIWAGIKNRCYNKNVRCYGRYGGIGITVCERWLSGDGARSGFECFYADMGDRPTAKHSIDRIDPFGNYEPSNCRWATQSTQARNTRKSKKLTFAGKTMGVWEWQDETGISAPQILKRLGRGWSVERALTQPMRGPGI